ncbi:hypothetical protein H0I39_09685 [Ottowia beijingensis]|uniref:Uncharacterized protein n=1 Tax=Ottowia beijingensis TaxID=1207057 RepID=A0A853IYC8_9BURK|nr:hypothetical protein [Ottowia beijingensis]NZA01959.1 hypothetical protein [Ottowia beijingensis]
MQKVVQIARLLRRQAEDHGRVGAQGQPPRCDAVDPTAHLHGPHGAAQARLELIGGMAVFRLRVPVNRLREFDPVAQAGGQSLNQRFCGLMGPRVRKAQNHQPTQLIASPIAHRRHRTLQNPPSCNGFVQCRRG